MTPSPEEPPVRLALLGAGTFARSAHLPVLLSLQSAQRVRVRLVWSRRAESAVTLASQYGPDVVAAYMVTDDSVAKPISDVETNNALASAVAALKQHQNHLDAVVLCVPIPDNAAFSRAVFSLGLHVLCEKPIAHSVDAGLALLADAPPSIHYAVAENYRYEPVYRAARQLIPSVCSSVVGLRLTAQLPMPRGSRYAFGWRLSLPNAGILTDSFVHNIAALRILAGSDVATVSARCVTNGSHFAGCDTATAHFTFENDLPASVFVTYAGAVFHWELVVVGTQGDIAIMRIPGKPGYRLLTKNNKDICSEEHFPFSGIEEEFYGFITSCQKNKLDPDLSARTAFNDMATVHSMFQSSITGQPIAVPKPDPE